MKISVPKKLWCYGFSDVKDHEVLDFGSICALNFIRKGCLSYSQ